MKATKGKSLKAENRHAVGLLLASVCGGLTQQVPVPDPDDDSSGGGDAGASVPEQTPKEAWDQAMRDFVNGKLNRDGLQAAANRYQCSLGVESKC